MATDTGTETDDATETLRAAILEMFGLDPTTAVGGNGNGTEAPPTTPRGEADADPQVDPTELAEVDPLNPDGADWIRGDLAEMVDPPDAVASELTAVNEARAAVLKALGDEPRRSHVNAAEGLLKGLADAIKQAETAAKARLDAERERRNIAVRAALGEVERAQEPAVEAAARDASQLADDVAPNFTNLIKILGEMAEKRQMAAIKSVNPKEPADGHQRTVTDLHDLATVDFATFSKDLATAVASAKSERKTKQEAFQTDANALSKRSIAVASSQLRQNSPSEAMNTQHKKFHTMRQEAEALIAADNLKPTATHAAFTAAALVVGQKLQALRDEVAAQEKVHVKKEVDALGAAKPATTIEALSADLGKMTDRASALKKTSGEFDAAYASEDYVGALEKAGEFKDALAPTKEFLAKFQAARAKNDAVRAVSGAGPKAVLQKLEDDIYAEADKDLGKAELRFDELTALGNRIKAFNEDVAKLKTEKEYKSATAGSDSPDKRNLNSLLAAASAVVDDDATLSKAIAKLGEVRDEAKTLAGRIVELDKLSSKLISALDPIKLSERLIWAALKRRIEALKTATVPASGYQAAIDLGKLIEGDITPALGFGKRKGSIESDILRMPEKFPGKSEVQSFVSAAGQAANVTEFSKADGLLNQALEGIAYARALSKVLESYEKTHDEALPDQQKSLATARDLAETVRTDANRSALETLLKDVKAITPKLKEIAALQKEFGGSMDSTTKGEVGKNHDDALQSARDLDFKGVEKNLGAAGKVLFKLRYDKMQKEDVAADAQATREITEQGSGSLKSEHTKLSTEAAAAYSNGQYETAVRKQELLRDLYTRVTFELEKFRYTAVRSTFDAQYKLMEAPAHATFRSDLAVWKVGILKPATPDSTEKYRTAKAAIDTVAGLYADIISLSKETKTVFAKYDVQFPLGGVPGDLKKAKKLYEDVQALAFTDPVKAKADITTLGTTLDTLKTNRENFQKPIATVSGNIHGARSAGGGTIRGGTDPASLVAGGVLTATNIGAMIPNGVNNNWTDSADLKDGFKYEFNSGNDRIHIHGHGSDSKAPTGSNSNSGGNIVRVTKTDTTTNIKQYLQSDGTWTASAAAEFADDTHIPLT